MKQIARTWLVTVAAGAVLGSGAGAALLATGSGSGSTVLASSSEGRTDRSGSSTSTTVASEISPDTTVAPATTVVEAPIAASVTEAALVPGASDPAAVIEPGVADPAASTRTRPSTNSTNSTGPSVTPGAAVPTGTSGGPTQPNNSPGQVVPPAPTPAPVAPGTPTFARVRLHFANNPASTREAAPLSIQVEWAPPTSGGPVASYTVVCRRKATMEAGTSVTVGAGVGAQSFPSLPVNVAHQCSVTANGAGGASPTANAGEATPLPQPAAVSFSSCRLGGPGGTIGERYLITGLATKVPTPPGLSSPIYRASFSLLSGESDLTAVGEYWVNMTEAKGLYGRSGGHGTASIWVQGTVSSGGRTLTMQSAPATVACT